MRNKSALTQKYFYFSLDQLANISGIRKHCPTKKESSMSRISDNGNTSIFSLIVALFSAGAPLWIPLAAWVSIYFFWQRPVDAQREQRILSCQAPAVANGHYADPVSGVCGAQDYRTVYPGSQEACWKILRDKRFAPVWHCWKKILQPQNP